MNSSQNKRPTHSQTERELSNFWQDQLSKLSAKEFEVDCKLPLARVKRVMKTDDTVNVRKFLS